MPKINIVILRSRNPLAQRQFYCDVLGMKAFKDGTVGYREQEARLSFVQASKNYDPTPRDLYWKISIAIPNIEIAHEQLTRLGVLLNEPRQFQDIGFLTHLSDPEGFTVELIEHEFAGQRLPSDTDVNLLGGGPHVNLLTLRTVEIEQVIKTCESWAMTPLSIQPVKEHGFTLYFYAFTDEKPPSSDLQAVVNRTWVYQRPYTVLEIQHLHDTDGIIRPAQETAGYAGTVFSGGTENFVDNDLGIVPDRHYT